VTRLEGHFPLEPDGVKSLLYPFAFGGFGTGLVAEAVVSGFQDVAMVRQPVEQCGGDVLPRDVTAFG
jgi:hypothetical protein